METIKVEYDVGQRNVSKKNETLIDGNRVSNQGKK